MREAARQNLGLYTTFPFFQRLFRASGFAAETAEMEKGATALYREIDMPFYLEQAEAEWGP